MSNEEKKAIEKYRDLYMQPLANNLNQSLKNREMSNEQLEALNEGWKIELEKKDNRIKELESDKEIKDKMIKLILDELVELYNNCEPCLMDFRVNCSEMNCCVDCIKQYFENLAKESGEIDEY